MYKEEVVKFTDTNTHQIQDLVDQKIRFWFDNVLFTGLWWLAFAFTVIPWMVWFAFRKKESTDRLMFAGQFVMIVSLVLDVIGDEVGLWYYRFNLIPVLPTYFPWDLTLMPVTIMFLIQFKPAFNPLIKAIIFALLSSYIGEPFFKWIGVYVHTNWKYTYSVPIQITIYLIANYLTRRNKYDPLER